MLKGSSHLDGSEGEGDAGDGGHRPRPRGVPGRDAFLVVSLRVSGWAFSTADNATKLVLDAKVRANALPLTLHIA